MKYTFLIIALLSVFQLEAQQKQKVIYTCVMHPEVKLDKPGNCPKCGMTLIKKAIKLAAPKQTPQKKVTTQTSKDTLQEKAIDKDNMKRDSMQLSQNDNQPQPTTYICLMHPEIHATKPGNCPKCGMKLVVEKTKPSGPRPATYTCPMHPEVHADKPGNCRKCGMELVKEKPKAVADSGNKNLNELEMPRNNNQQPITYTCSMHPEIHADKPGNCPKCGMKLVQEKPKSSKGDQAQPISYTCPMHSEIHATKPGNCPKCGMKLVVEKIKPSGAQPATYTCPMHPEIHADKPGNCPKCGMKLVKEKPANMDDMGGMQMDDNTTMEKIMMAKKNLGPIKTITSQLPPRTVVYHLYIRDTTVTFGKKPKRAIAVNGMIPMPTLTFTEGDTAEIWVHNELKEVTSVHWHGLFLPNKMDGVPFVTQMPIKPGATYLYKFPIVQHGTHWYYSHSGLQEQIGMYGAFIMNKRKEWDIPTIPVVLSEWTDMKPEEVHRSLHAATDWFAVQKGSTQSYSEAIKKGQFKTKVVNEWKRMNAMDLTDIYYDNFLINGKNQNEQPQFKAGDKVRLRIANGGASDYFWLSYSGGKITVVATDGNDVEPVEVDRLIIAVSETYDVVVTVPENKSYEFLVTPEDRTKFASMWLGSGEKVPAVKLKRPKYFAGMKMMNDMMDMKGNMIEMKGMKMQNQIMDMNTVVYPEITGPENPKDTMKAGGMENMKMNGDKETPMDHSSRSMSGLDMGNSNSDIVSLNYEMLRAPEKTTLPKGPWKELKFDLTGNMNRYVWSLDNKVVSESDKILIRKGENIRIILFNNSMMRHPMHLHGHDFRLLNGQGENAIMKNIIDIMPMERDTIEFAANEAGGDWFFHCHILYHMMSGMGRVFSYDNPLVDKTDITNPKVARR